MQTFITDPDFTRSAVNLDMRRLGKQRVEALQILITIQKMCLENPSIKVNGEDGHIISRTLGWSHHPAVRMWFGYTDFLAMYYNSIVNEWVRRGYKHEIKMSEYIKSGDIKEFKIRTEAQNFIRKTGGVHPDPKGDRIIEFIEPLKPFVDVPWWWTENKWKIIDSHREALIIKDRKWYAADDGPCGYWVHQRRNPMPTEYWWPYDKTRGREHLTII
jgi:hypothetical protein